jgi:hypothetical protein
MLADPSGCQSSDHHRPRSCGYPSLGRGPTSSLAHTPLVAIIRHFAQPLRPRTWRTRCQASEGVGEIEPVRHVSGGT